ncbi:zinc transporter ZupT [Corynebacterium pseudodiphtheriticum]|uniref:zinc transporter ZupT n=1 Tax=Corynebacterium pseudodiphtheriticum TaxID=37637 RepID=UPI002540BB9D|nr:zinc transporter ZupT [Corynebacterium pseudodiphtheriticum]MDK4338972.1 zinc transporter ZupT [Corynebacterium pseudodiphtheriticum]
MYETSTILFAFALTLGAGLSTGIGGAIAVAKKRPGPAFMAIALGLSAGVMLYVSFVEILPKAMESIGGWAVAGFFAGIALILVVDRLVPEDVNPHEPLQIQKDARSRFLKTGVFTAVAIAIHNFPEGLVTFIAGLEEPEIAVGVALAIAIHNIPEGIAVAIPLREALGSRWKAWAAATLSGLAEPLGAFVGFALLMPVMGPVALGFVFSSVAGVMVFISLDKLLPTAEVTGRHHAAIYGLIAGMAIMAVSLLLGA